MFHYFTIKFHLSFFAYFRFKFLALLHFSHFRFEVKQSEAKFKSIYFLVFFSFFTFFRFFLFFLCFFPLIFVSLWFFRLCGVPHLAHQISPPAGYLGRYPRTAKPQSLVKCLWPHVEIVADRSNCIYCKHRRPLSGPPSNGPRLNTYSTW